MGYDVTFHPVSAKDLQRYVFDIVDQPRLAKARAQEIARTKEQQSDLLDGVLTRLPAFVDELEGTAGESFGNTVAFAAAAVMGYIHPYWYARGAALTFLVAKRIVTSAEVPFASLPTLARGRVAKLKDASFGYLAENYTASGFLPPESVIALETVLDRLAAPKKGKPGPLFETFDDDSLDSLRRALRYAREHGLGLMEATDLVVPMDGSSNTNVDNMRAHWLGNVAYDKAGPPPKKAPSAKKTAPKKTAPKKTAPKKAATTAKKAAPKKAATTAKKAATTAKKAATTAKKAAPKKTATTAKKAAPKKTTKAKKKKKKK